MFHLERIVKMLPSVGVLGPKLVTLRGRRKLKSRGNKGFGTKARRMINTSNVLTQALSKSFLSRKSAVIVHPKGSKYASTNKPLYKRVLYNIKSQLFIYRCFKFFHNNEVIGLRGKFNNKNLKCKKKINNSNEFYE